MSFFESNSFMALTATIILVSNAWSQPDPLPSQAIAELHTQLIQDIPHASSLFLEKITKGRKWLVSYETVQTNLATHSTEGFTDFILQWNNFEQASPSTLVTRAALDLRSQLALAATNLKTIKSKFQQLEPLAKELVLELEALDRIERHRRRNVTIRVVGADKKPVEAVQFNIAQINHAFLFGCNLFRWRDELTDSQQKYRDQFAELFNFATLGFYWAAYEPRQGETIEPLRRKAVEWCRMHNIETKGHPLVWNYSDPQWLPSDPQEVYRLQMNRIQREVTNFTGLIDIWDVINEVTAFDRKSFWERAPKTTRMWETIGQMELAKRSFRQARQANPKATLLINDYYLQTREEADRDDSIQGAEREIYEDVIDSLVDQNGNKLYDVIGIQSHMHDHVWSTNRILSIVKRFSKYGVPIHFTETTIVSGPRAQNREWDETTIKQEMIQKEEVERFYRTIFSCPEVEALTWWDFSDDRAWQGAPAGFIRKDMSPKPAYHRLLELIKGEWWTHQTVHKTASSLEIRAFLGDYVVTVTTKDGKQHSRIMHLPRGDKPFVFTFEL